MTPHNDLFSVVHGEIARERAPTREHIILSVGVRLRTIGLAIFQPNKLIRR
jgi:hypothetical protein